MRWLHRNKQEPKAFDERFATAAEIESVFDAECEKLHWIAYAITGDTLLAEESLVDARGLQPAASGVFRDWLVRWVESATARTAASKIGESLRNAAKKYADRSCDHPDHAVTSEESALLAQLRAQDIVDALDPFARTILMLRAVQQTSISEGALLLNVSRRAVLGAHCHALQWLRTQTLDTVTPTSSHRLDDSGPARF